MGSEGSVPPSDRIPLVDAYGGPRVAWGALELLGLVFGCFSRLPEGCLAGLRPI
jgi:hypothetical protein